MKLYSRKFYRRLRRGVRREVKAKAEWRKTARSIRWGRLNRVVDNAYVRAFALPAVLAGSAAYRDPALLRFTVVMWMTWMASLRVFQIQSLALGGARPTPLLQFPVTSHQVWKYLFSQVVRRSQWVAFDGTICFAIAGYHSGQWRVGVLWGLVPAMVLVWASVLSICVLLFWKLPRQRFWLAACVIPAVWGAVLFLFHVGMISAPGLQRASEWLMWLTPPGWACQLLAWFAHARADFPATATGLLLLCVALAVPAYRALVERYVFWQLDEVEAPMPVGTPAMAAVSVRVERVAMDAGDGEDEAAGQADMEAAALMAQRASLSEVEMRVRAGDFLQVRTHAGGDVLDRLFLPHSGRAAVVMDYLLVRAPRWGASYRIGVVTLITGILGVLLFKQLLGPTLSESAFAIACMSGLGGMTPLFGGQWVGFSLGRIPPRLVPASALWPIGLREIRDAILRVNLGRFVVALPCWLLAGGLGAFVWDSPPILGLRCAFFLWLILLLFQPVALIFKYSQGTNDTSSGCLNALAITVMILLVVAAIIWFGWTVLWPAAWWWQATALTGFALVSVASEVLYRGLYCRHRFDLLAKARPQ